MTTFEKSTLVVVLVVAVSIPWLIPGAASVVGMEAPTAYLMRVAATALYFIILASSWNLLLGYAGVLSFAHAAFAGIGAYTTGLLSAGFLGDHVCTGALNFDQLLHAGGYLFSAVCAEGYSRDFNAGVHPLIGIFVGCGVAAGIGWCLGRMCLRTRGPYLALMTLGFSETVRLILQIEHDYTRGSLGLRIPYLWTTEDGKFNHPVGYLIMLALTVITLVVLYRLVNSEKGLYLKAIREDEDVASVMGVDLVKWKVRAFVISSAFAGLAGAVYAHLFVQVLAPQELLIIVMGLILAMTIVGGLGTLTGPVIGALLLVILWEIMRDYSPYAHMLLFATLVILVMKFFRAGIFGLVAIWLKEKNLISKAPPFTIK
ncbi:MAG: branched-chain amino acid ABC transporter permease [Pseudomonadota bacterium]|jgi:branched-chain amino acid transport system permease protein|nr:branched-chain amino acid ABC transporter permease [Pseudomonadota bacterium]